MSKIINPTTLQLVIKFNAVTGELRADCNRDESPLTLAQILLQLQAVYLNQAQENLAKHFGLKMTVNPTEKPTEKPTGKPIENIAGFTVQEPNEVKNA